MTHDPYATARTYHVRSQELGHDPKFDDDAVSLYMALTAAEPGRVYDSAAGWKSAAGRLAGLADLLRMRIAPALAEAWGGEAATASQAALQKIHATAQSLSSSSKRMADALETTAGKLAEAKTGLPDNVLDALDQFTQWELQRRFWQLEDHYISHAPYQMPTAVSANLPGIQPRDHLGGYGPSSSVGGVVGQSQSLGFGGVGPGHGFTGSSGGLTSGGIPAGSPVGPGGTSGGVAGHPFPGSGWGALDTPSANGSPVDDGYVPVGSDTDLAGLDGNQYAGGQFGSAGYTPGVSGSSGFGPPSGSGFGAGGVGTGGSGAVPGLGGVPGTRAGVGESEPGIGRGGSGLGGRGAPGTPTGGGGMAPPMSGGAGSEDEEERERDSWLGEDAEVWRADDVVSPAVIGQADEEPPERPERRRRRRS